MRSTYRVHGAGVKALKLNHLGSGGLDFHGSIPASSAVKPVFYVEMASGVVALRRHDGDVHRFLTHLQHSQTWWFRRMTHYTAGRRLEKKIAQKWFVIDRKPSNAAANYDCKIH